MLKEDENKILRILKVSPIIVIVISILISYYIIRLNTNQFNMEIKEIEESTFNERKMEIKNRVEKVYELIQYEKSQAETKLKKNLKNHGYQAYTIAMSIYKNNQDKSKIEITKMIKDALRDIRFNDGRGFFFIYDLGGTTVLTPLLPKREGHNALNLKDKKGNYHVKERIALVKEKSEGFTRWWWVKSKDSKKEYEKIGFNKLFKPLNWVIVSAEYIVDWEDKVKKETLHKIQKIQYSQNGYVFIANYKGTILSHINPKFINQNKIDMIDKKGYFTMKAIVKTAKSGEGFISYVGISKPNSGKEAEKTSFIKGCKKWQWAIGSGAYISDINEDILQKQTESYEKNKNQLQKIMLINILTFTVLILFSLYISFAIKRRFQTYKKTVEEQRKKLILFNNNLENEVKKRTIQYQNATEDAQSANIAKSTFLANMSHEIRTPLNAILGFVNILKDNETDRDKSKYLETILSSSDALLSIINDILDFAKIESGKMTLDCIVVNPHVDFGSIGSLFFAKAEDMSLKFDLYIDPYLPKKVIIDSLKIRQVITNLLSNAIKFSNKEGTVSLKIKYNSENSTIFFQVKDNGIGIAKENHNKIFKSFSQEEDSTSRQYGGTGLGLSISSKIVEMMHSRLEVESELGKGSEFSFTLKVEFPNEKEEDFTLLPNIKSKNIALFCTEKNQDKLNILKEYLESFGMKNLAFPQKIEDITSTQYPLIIMDLDMYNDENIQLYLDKWSCLMIIKTSLHQQFPNNFHGKVEVIDPPFTPSSIHDALLDLFMDDKEQVLIDTPKEKTNKNFDKNAHILIAEDNTANQFFMKVIMEKLGLSFAFANDGLEAISMFKEGGYDLILMDENMPNMNGTEAVQNILKIENENNLTHIPIISLTANAIKGDRERFLKAGMDEYLSKPISVNDLAEVFAQFLPADENQA